MVRFSSSLQGCSSICVFRRHFNFSSFISPLDNLNDESKGIKSTILTFGKSDANQTGQSEQQVRSSNEFLFSSYDILLQILFKQISTPTPLLRLGTKKIVKIFAGYTHNAALAGTYPLACSFAFSDRLN